MTTITKADALPLIHRECTSMGIPSELKTVTRHRRVKREVAPEPGFEFLAGALKSLEPEWVEEAYEVPSLYVNGADVEYLFSVEVQGKAWRGNSRQVIKVGGFGMPFTTNFPRRQDGSFNWPKIAQALAQMVNRNKELLQAQMNRQTAGQRVEALRTRLGLPYGGRVSLEASGYEASPIKMTFTIQVHGDEAKVEAAIRALAEQGYVILKPEQA